MSDTLPFRVLMLLPDENTRVSSPDTAVSLASSYYLFRDAGLEVVFSSRLGGFSSISAEMRRLVDEPAVSRIMLDAFARDELSETVPLEKVYVGDFDALVLFVDVEELDRGDIAATVSEFAQAGKPVVASGVASSPDNDRWSHDIMIGARAKAGR